MKAFIDEHFNTLLITGLILVFVGVTMHIIHDKGDGSNIQWIENLDGQFVSALLTLLVAKKVIGSNGGPNPPSPPSAPNP
jgi:hypothetical protein